VSIAAPQLSRLEALRGLRISIYEGVWATVWMVLTTGAFQIGFARSLGATDFILGLLAGLPAAVGLLQLPASLFVARLGERKRFIAAVSLSGRLCWVLIALLPFAPDPFRLPAFVALLVLSSALMTSGVPAWTSWMSDLVPADARGRYFARRNTVAGVVAMLVPLPAGWFMDRVEPARGFPLLFGIACVAAIGAFTQLVRQPEPPMPRAQRPENPLASLAAPLADRNFRRFLVFSGTVVVGQGLAGQFFLAWQVDKHALALPYLATQMLGAVAAGAGLATTPVWGYLADKYGGRPVLMIASWGVLAAPFLWLFTEPGALWTNIALIVLINILSGACWAAVGLTQFNLLLGLAGPAERATYVAVFSAFTGVVGGIAPVVGGLLMNALATVAFSIGPVHFNNYKLLFALTELVRIAALVLLKAVTDGDSRSTRYVLEQLASSRPVTSYRTIQRLASPTGEAERRETVEKIADLRSPMAVEELARALSDVSPEVREGAAHALGEIGDRRAVPALAQVLGDPAAGIGAVAALALGEIGGSAARDALVQALAGPDAAVRIAAIQALGRIADPQSATALMEALDPIHATRCEAACAALAAIGPRLDLFDAERLLPKLFALLSPAIDRGMRLAAARTLGTLPPTIPGAFAPLVRRIGAETDPAVLARLAVDLVRIARATHRAIDAVIPALERTLEHTRVSALAYLQALTALADATIEPGQFYPLLGLPEMPRDETASRMLRELGRSKELAPAASGALAAFTQGDYADCIARLAGTIRPEATDGPAVALRLLAHRADTRADILAEEALLAIAILASRAGH
jgi:HEAT repeat protein